MHAHAKVFVTMRDIANVVGLSKNTVSLALNRSSRVPATTRDRIEKVARDLGYTKNPMIAKLMTQLRSSRAPRHLATLGLFNANTDREALQRHPTLPTYIEGCRRRATELGYSLDEFWLHNRDLDAKRLVRILKSRNIQGGIVVGMMDESQLPQRFETLWGQLPFVVTGVRTHNPTLSFCCADHHACAMKAFEKAIQLGYRRPALVLDEVIDHLVEGRFSAGICIAQRSIPAENRTSPFYKVREARKDPQLFRSWLETERPDAILTLFHEVKNWLVDANRRVPEDVALIQLEWRKEHCEWAGVNQHNDIVGEAAVEMLAGMINQGISGVPTFPRAVLVGPSWVDGRTA